MRNHEALKARFSRDSISVRLGGIAANLARVESFSASAELSAAVERLIDESKYFIEWVAPDAPPDTQLYLIGVQRSLAQWQRDWHQLWNDPVRRLHLKTQAAAWAEELLNLSGLLGGNDATDSSVETAR